MTPILPHFIMNNLSDIRFENFKWPYFDKAMLKDEIINIVIQINGKKED